MVISNDATKIRLYIFLFCFLVITPFVGHNFLFIYGPRSCLQHFLVVHEAFGPIVIQIIILFAFISIEHHLSLLVQYNINSDIVPVSKNVFGKPKLDSYNELQNYS